MDDPSRDFALETAACLWEGVLALRDSPGLDPESVARAHAIRASFEAAGTGQIRLDVVGWSDAVDAAWAAVQDSYQMSFDWDFVPEWIIANIDWSDPGNPLIRPASGGGEDVGNGGGDEAASNPESPMTYPTTIRTTVGSSIISKVGRLFNGTASDVLHELLQNARRAGATRVDIETLATDRGPVLRIRDDGRGIADPAKFVTLGDSGWDGDVARSEDPAGMGVFSLAGRHVTVRSRPADAADGWQVTIPPDAWETSQPLDLAIADLAKGTEIDIDLPDSWAPFLIEAVKNAATYYPLPVTFDGAIQARSSFLQKAERIEEWHGCRIGVFKDTIDLDRARINFHGLTVPCTLPHVHDAEGGDGWVVRVEIVDAPDLQLVLPARKEMVVNTALDALREACEAAIYRTIAHRGHHRLSFTDWRRARDLGVWLPEASPWLNAWQPCTAEADGTIDGERIAGEPMILLPYEVAHIEQCMARAIGEASLRGAKPVRTVAAFAGYAWYDALPRVVDLNFRIARGEEQIDYDGEQELPADLDSGRVDGLTLELTIQASGDPLATFDVIELPADVVIAPTERSPDLEETVILLAPDCAISPPELAWLLEMACFCPSDDSGDDSFETQQARFELESRFIANNLLLGEDAALLARVRDAMVEHVTWLMPRERSFTVEVGDGNVEIAFAANDPGPLPAAA